MGKPKPRVIPEPHLDWRAREGFREEKPCPVIKCSPDKMVRKEHSLGKKITFLGKLNRKYRSFQMEFLYECPVE